MFSFIQRFLYKYSEVPYNEGVAEIKTLIDENTDDYTEFWTHGGDELIFKILDEFTSHDWDYLKKDLKNWTDDQLSVFAGAILFYNHNDIDEMWIFGYIFTILNDLEQCDCFLQDLYLLAHISPKDIDLLNQVKVKIEIIRQSYKGTFHTADSFDRYQGMIDEMIAAGE